MSYDTLLSDAERFYNEAQERAGAKGSMAERLTTAAIVFSFMAVESFINNMMADFTSLPATLFTVHERGFLSEKTVVFSAAGTTAGTFILGSRPEYKPLEEKILFLIARFAGDTVDKGGSLWQRFVMAKDVRDRLTHPRKGAAVSLAPAEAANAIQVAKEIIGLVSNKVWGRTVDF